MRALKELSAALAVSAGALCVDASSLYLLTSVAHLHYLVAASIAFMAGTLVAWYLSVRYVFGYRRCGSAAVEFAYFAVIGLCGLVPNALVIATVVEYLGLHYMIGKACAAVVTFGFNYSLRKVLLFSPMALGIQGRSIK